MTDFLVNFAHKSELYAQTAVGNKKPEDRLPPG